MPRLHLFEIHEQPWFPQSLRDAVTDSLQVVLNCTLYHKQIAPLLRSAMDRAGANRCVDLCSGGGGPWFRLVQLLGAQQDSSVCLTDIRPNHRSFCRLQSAANGLIAFRDEPVSAERVPSSLQGFRTIFNSFHHFNPDHARCVLADAVSQRQGIGVFELPRRSLAALLGVMLTPFGTALFLPLVRPFKFSLFFWTYIVPLVPFVVWFDGVMSCLRAYTPDEMHRLASDISSYCWLSGCLRRGPFSVNYVIGYPLEETLSGDLRAAD